VIDLVALMFSLENMLGPEERFDRTSPPGEFIKQNGQTEKDDFQLIDDVLLALKVRKDGDKCRVSGQINSRLSLSCCRCLELFEMPGNIEIDLLYLPQDSNWREAEKEISEDDLTAAYYQNNEINFSEMVREQFQLILPMKPLCRSDCLGLCALCGLNLNEQRCSCKAEWQDTRFAELAKLLPNQREH